MQREAKFEKINRWFFPAYVLLCLGAAVYYGVRRDMYHFPLSLLAPRCRRRSSIQGSFL